MQDQYWSVAVEAPLPDSLTYEAPEELAGVLLRGQAVEVPLGKRKAQGVLLGTTELKPNGFEIKKISGINSEYAPLPEKFLEWLEWIAKYYQYPIGQVTSLAFPPLKRQEKARKSNRPPVVPELPQQLALDLTEEQQQVCSAIEKEKGFSTHLLFGVTGSGKTEVYLQLLEKILKQGKSGLVLVPEISLTPQLIHRFAARFGDQIAVLHSQLTDRERTNQWWQVVDGEKKILIGARSALFCPIPDLGLIIVDEEHEPSFKQDEKLKYHGRDAAVMMGKMMDCPVILGSATPSLESWKNAQEGRYTVHHMRKRVQDRSLPQVEIVDMRLMEKDDFRPEWLSPQLMKAMEETLARKEQVALFLNRRGSAQVVLCRACGYAEECPNCDISLTLHGKSHLVCHYCDYHQSFRFQCPSCKEGELSAIGLGTELLQEEIQKLFPEAKIARADRDEIQTRTDLEELVHNMESGETDILIGTQMIAKGLDFPKLTLVGLVLADIGFNLPDFRATERAFQLMTQVSGRAGRHVKPGEAPGRVFIQTYNTDHPALLFAQKNDFEGFAQTELATRTVLNYPPFGRLISYRIQGTQLARVQETARLLAQRALLLKERQPSYQSIEVLGPAEAPIARLRGQYRYQLLLKSTSPQVLGAFSRTLIGDQEWLETGTRITIDVDPVNLL